MDNINNLTKLEKRYFESTEKTISVPEIIGKYTIGAIIICLSSFVTPSAEGKLPFSSFFFNTKNSIKYTKYKKAVIRKLNGDDSNKNNRILQKLNNEVFVFDQKMPDTNTEDQNIEQIYSDYLKEHENDSK